MQLIEHLAKVTCKFQKQKYLLQVQHLKVKFKYIFNSKTFMQHKTGPFIYIHILT